MLVGACDGAVQALLTGRLTPRFGERPVLLFGMLCGIASFLLMGLASEGWIFLLGIPLMALWGLSNPPIQSIMTQQVEPSEQGRLQGASTSLSSFAGIFGPYLFAQVFALSIAPGAHVHVPGRRLRAGRAAVAGRHGAGGARDPRRRRATASLSRARAILPTHRMPPHCRCMRPNPLPPNHRSNTHDAFHVSRFRPRVHSRTEQPG